MKEALKKHTQIYKSIADPESFQHRFQISKKVSVKFNDLFLCLTQHEILSKKTIPCGCLQYGIKQKSVIFVVYDLES